MIEVVGLLGIMVGLIQIVIALLGLGDLTRYISESVILGFMAGAGLLVALTQMQNLLGLKDVPTQEHYLLSRLWHTWTQEAPIDRRAGNWPGDACAGGRPPSSEPPPEGALS